MKPKEIGQRIHDLRKQKGLNQTELAKMLGKSLRTVQKYESGEIEPSIAIINELSKLLDTTATYLLGYKSDSININSLSDIMDFLFKLENKEDINFSIDVKKPKTDGCWQCSITFDGQNADAAFNSSLCMFLEEYENYREKLNGYWISTETYKDWQDKTLAYHASHPLTDKTIEEMDTTTRLKKRNALMKAKYSDKE